MKMYAELMGNLKKYEIKSSYDNKMAIEYTSDVLMGLQFQNTPKDESHAKKAAKDGNGFDMEKEKKKKMRKIECVVIKNRNGIPGQHAYFNYSANYNTYLEMEKPQSI